MRTRDRFKYVFRPRPPTWRQKLERGEGLLFWILTTLGSVALLFCLVFVMTLEP